MASFFHPVLLTYLSQVRRPKRLRTPVIVGFHAGRGESGISKLAQIIVLVTSLALILSGVYVISVGLSKVIDDKPHNIVTEINDYFIHTGQFQAFFFIKTKTVGAFLADNPINVSVTTNPLQNVKGIEIDFLGAGKYFPDNTASPARPPEGSSEQAWNQYEQAMREWVNASITNLHRMSESIMFLKNDTDLVALNPFQNITSPVHSTFSGELSNLTYSVGGEFSIGIEITESNGAIVGYWHDEDTSYMINNVMTISPPETLLQIESNNILTGLGWIGVGVSPLIAGLVILIEFVKPYATPTKRRIYDGDWE